MRSFCRGNEACPALQLNEVSFPGVVAENLVTATALSVELSPKDI